MGRTVHLQSFKLDDTKIHAVEHCIHGLLDINIFVVQRNSKTHPRTIGAVMTKHTCNPE